jgi:shikimate kinase
MPKSPAIREVRDVPIIAITGFMAAGKSTVGRSLAWLLKWRLLDLDFEIESRCGQSIHEIFTQCGEAEFRRIEAEALRCLVREVGAPTVIALGGGTLVEPRNAGLLRSRGVKIVFLDVPFDELLRRCRCAGERSASNPRPLAQDEETLRTLHTERLPHYRRADLVVDANDKTPEHIAQEIARALDLLDAAR